MPSPRTEDDAPARPALRCSALTKSYAGVTAVAGIDLEIKERECFGLLGPNGAGKTTTVEIFEGLSFPDSGVVEVLGCRWGAGRDRWLRNRLGVQLQETRLSEKLTAAETIQLFCSFYENRSDADDLVRMVGLGEKRDARVGKLSGGQQQSLALACALAGKPELLFLDEPTTGLDPQARLNLWELVEGFRSAGGTVFLTTHYMEEASRLCDRVAIMDRGRIIALGSPAELIRSLGAEQIVEFSVSGELDSQSLAALPGVRGERRLRGAHVLTVSDIGTALPALFEELERRGVRLLSLTTHQATLEDVFVALTGRMLRDD